jgi:hypothetical protein
VAVRRGASTTTQQVRASAATTRADSTSATAANLFASSDAYDAMNDFRIHFCCVHKENETLLKDIGRWSKHVIAHNAPLSLFDEFTG